MLQIFLRIHWTHHPELASLSIQLSIRELVFKPGSRRKQGGIYMIVCMYILPMYWNRDCFF